jgi:serine/threonine protein kinase
MEPRPVANVMLSSDNPTSGYSTGISDLASNLRLSGVRPVPTGDHHVTDDDGVGSLSDKFSYNASELIVLLKALGVPFLRHRYRSAPSTELVGKGGFSEVKHDVVSDWQKGYGAPDLDVAVKEFTWETVDEEEEDLQPVPAQTITQAFIEVSIMKHPRLARSPNIIELVGFTDYWWGSQSSNWPALCLVTEYADLGSLDAYLDRHANELDWAVKSHFLCDIIRGLQALHKSDIVHNDVKCANVLICASESSETKMIAKLSDFGFSVPLATTNAAMRIAGTLIFGAPEACSHQSKVKPSRDIYSFGLLMVHVISEKPVFVRDVDDDNILEFKKSSKFTGYVLDRLKLSSNVPPSHQLHESILAALNADPAERLPDLSKITGHLEPGEMPGHTSDDTVNGLDIDWLVRVLTQKRMTTVEIFDKV